MVIENFFKAGTIVDKVDDGMSDKSPVSRIMLSEVDGDVDTSDMVAGGCNQEILTYIDGDMSDLVAGGCNQEIVTDVDGDLLSEVDEIVIDVDGDTSDLVPGGETKRL